MSKETKEVESTEEETTEDFDPKAKIPAEGQTLDDEGNLIPDFSPRRPFDPMAALGGKEESSEEESETPSDSPPDDKTGEEEPESSTEEEGQEEPEAKKDEDQVPFHEHPRWKNVYGELQELREFKEEVVPILQNLNKDEEETVDEIPKWFEKTFGNDEEAWEEYIKYDQSQKEQLKQNVIEEIRQQSEKAEKQQNEYDRWVEQEVQALKAEGLEFDRNKLIKTALDFMPTDEEGKIDLRKAYKIMNMQESKPKETKEGSTQESPEKSSRRDDG